MIEYDIDSVLDFGIYKGKTIQEIVIGADSIENELISKYIEELYRCFFFGGNEFDIPYSTTQFDRIARFYRHIQKLKKLKQEEGLELNLCFNENVIQTPKTCKLALTDSFITTCIDKLRFQKFGVTSSGVVLNSVIGTILTGKSEFDYSPNTLELHSKLSNATYIRWLINYRSGFILSDECMNLMQKCELNWLNELLFSKISDRKVEFEIELQKIEMPDKLINQIRELNLKKREYLGNVMLEPEDPTNEYLWLRPISQIKRTDLDKH